MNEESNHLTPVGDEALEARIIAWVLGEASPFEAAELENICEQNPEWRVFQRRMLAVHQLLGEATAVSTAGDWKMPTEKRGKLDSLIGTVDVVKQAPRRKPVRWWPRAIGLAAALAIVAVVGSLATGKFGKETKDIIATHNAKRDVGVFYSMQEEEPAVRKMQNFPVTPATPGVDESVDAFAEGEGNERPSRPSSSILPPLVEVDEPAELPNSVRITDGLAAASGGSVSPAGGEADPFMATGEADPFRSSEPQKSVGTTAVPGVLASRGVSASAETVTADPFASASDGEGEGDSGGSALLHRGPAPAEEATRLATGDRVPRLEEMPQIGAVFDGKPSAANSERSRDLSSVREGGLRNDLSDFGEKAEQAGGGQGGGFSDADEGLARSNNGRGKKSADDYSDYNRSSGDQKPVQLLTDVDRAWELEIPQPAGNSVEGEKAQALAEVSEKKKETAGNNTFKGNTKVGAGTLNLDKKLESVITTEKDSSVQDAAKKAVIKLPDITEILAQQDPYSTFSLRVSDNSFRVAQAAMARNERPAPESVRVEEFYNAFDYGDPVPTAQEPVAAVMEQAAHPILPQRNLLRIALRTAAAGRGAGQPLHLTLLVDQSGSMSRGDRNTALAASIKELSTLLTAQDQISVIGFSRTPRLLAEKIPGDQHARLIDMLARTPSDGGTNLEEALKLGEVVAKRNHRAGAQNRLLLLTDGAANLGNADPERLAAWVKTLRQQNIAFDIAGIGTDGLNDPLLVEIARNGNGRYYVMNDAKQAKQDFAAQLAGAFRPAAENVKVQVQFNPQRVGKYKLVGFEKDRLRTEDFRNDKVDAAEMAAAEAGQALYQVELLPEGTGDVGEVSVRFRDAATQQMVERKWTIRYDSATPAFDRATPTMQLAGLAMLTAEKLQGREAASIIRFSELQEPQQRVRESFSSSKRVGELLEMIQQLNQ